MGWCQRKTTNWRPVNGWNKVLIMYFSNKNHENQRQIVQWRTFQQVIDVIIWKLVYARFEISDGRLACVSFRTVLIWTVSSAHSDLPGIVVAEYAAPMPAQCCFQEHISRNDRTMKCGQSVFFRRSSWNERLAQRWIKVGLTSSTSAHPYSSAGERLFSGTCLRSFWKERAAHK